jgi:hypothetical protein
MWAPRPARGSLGREAMHEAEGRRCSSPTQDGAGVSKCDGFTDGRGGGHKKLCTVVLFLYDYTNRCRYRWYVVLGDKEGKAASRL